MILPITDPYVAHHGSLGSFATVYLPAGADAARACARAAQRSGHRGRAAARRSRRAVRAAARPHRRRRRRLRAALRARHERRRGTTCPGWTRRCARTAACPSRLVPLLFNRPLSDVDPRPAAAQLRRLRSRAQPRRLTAAPEEPAMAHWQYHNPGRGALRRRRPRVAARSVLRGRKASSSPSPRRGLRPAAAAARSSLGASLVGVIDQTQPNPDVDGLDALYRAFWREQRESEVIVAVGGGSALDTAKALMVGTAERRVRRPGHAARHRQAVHAAPRQAADRRSHDLGHRQRGYPLGDGVEPRRRQEVFAAPAARPGPKRRSSIPS